MLTFIICFLQELVKKLVIFSNTRVKVIWRYTLIDLAYSCQSSQIFRLLMHSVEILISISLTVVGRD